MIDSDGYCRECGTKHGPWGHNLAPEDAWTYGKGKMPETVHEHAFSDEYDRDEAEA